MNIQHHLDQQPLRPEVSTTSPLSMGSEKSLSLQAPDLLNLIEIFEPECQIAVVPRTHLKPIDAYLELAALQMGSGFRTIVKTGESIPAYLLPDLPGRDALLSDIAFLTELYADLLGCESVGVRVEVLKRAMCPRFHVDRSGIRLLCTYRGSGTEWLRESDVDRTKLGFQSAGMSDETSGVILNPDAIQALETYTIALIKGSAWEDNAQRGLVHRSPTPAVQQSPRVLLALDAIW